MCSYKRVLRFSSAIMQVSQLLVLQVVHPVCHKGVYQPKRTVFTPCTIFIFSNQRGGGGGGCALTQSFSLGPSGEKV